MNTTRKNIRFYMVLSSKKIDFYVSRATPKYIEMIVRKFCLVNGG